MLLQGTSAWCCTVLYGTLHSGGGDCRSEEAEAGTKSEAYLLMQRGGCEDEDEQEGEEEHGGVELAVLAGRGEPEPEEDEAHGREHVARKRHHQHGRVPAPPGRRRNAGSVAVSVFHSL